MLLRLTAGHTESQNAAVQRAEFVSKRRPTKHRVTLPSAAADDAARAPSRANWIDTARKVSAEPIRTPLPYVAVHIVKAPRIRLLEANLVSVFLTSIESVAVEPRIVAQL